MFRRDWRTDTTPPGTGSRYCREAWQPSDSEADVSTQASDPPGPGWLHFRQTAPFLDSFSDAVAHMEGRLGIMVDEEGACYNPQTDGSNFVSVQPILFEIQDCFEWHPLAPALAEDTVSASDSASSGVAEPFSEDGINFPNQTAVQLAGDPRACDIFEVPGVFPGEYCSADAPPADQESALEQFGLAGCPAGFGAPEVTYTGRLDGPSLLIDWGGAACQLPDYSNVVDADNLELEDCWASCRVGEEQQGYMIGEQVPVGDITPVVRCHPLEAAAATSRHATSMEFFWGTELRQVPFAAGRKRAGRSRRPSSFGTASTCGTESSVAAAGLPLLEATSACPGSRKQAPPRSSPCSLISLDDNDANGREGDFLSPEFLREWAGRRAAALSTLQPLARREGSTLTQKKKHHSDQQGSKILRKVKKNGTGWQPHLLPPVPYHVQIVMLTAAMSSQGLTAYLDAARPVHYED